MSTNSNYYFTLLPLLLLLLTPPSISTTTTTTTLHALLTLRGTLKGRTLQWNTTTNPCNWYGVHCHSGVITSLRLPASSLSGPIPRGILSSFPHLRILSLRSNHLTGPLPSDLASCSQLRYLYLQRNSFTGPIPEFIGNLKNLVRLNLGHNGFTGVVPLFLGDMRGLKRVYLENNDLVGVLPEYDNIDFEIFNVSGNRLSGSVPNGLSSFPVSSFLGNAGLCGKPLGVCEANGYFSDPRDLSAVHWKKGKTSSVAVTGIVIGCVLSFALLLMVIILIYIKNKSKKSHESNSNIVTTNNKMVYFRNGVDGKMFELEQLLRSPAQILGKGTFGTTYKVSLETGTVVAVKKAEDVKISNSEFKDKVDAVGALVHDNLVPLLGYYCHKNGDKLFVSEYMPMGSLCALLHGGTTPLNWERRSSIALGIANGINYLHSKGVPHGNIKSSNILLTTSHDPRVSDFAQAYLMGPSSGPTTPNGYCAPELAGAQTASQKADVYSFGVLIMELLTGKAPTPTLSNVDLPRWVNSVPKDGWSTNVLDLELQRYQHQLKDEMVDLLQLAVDCTAQLPDLRPTMGQVTERIEELKCHSQMDGDACLDIV